MEFIHHSFYYLHLCFFCEVSKCALSKRPMTVSTVVSYLSKSYATLIFHSDTKSCLVKMRCSLFFTILFAIEVSPVWARVIWVTVPIKGFTSSTFISSTVVENCRVLVSLISNNLKRWTWRSLKQILSTWGTSISVYEFGDRWHEYGWESLHYLVYWNKVNINSVKMAAQLCYEPTLIRWDEV